MKKINRQSLVVVVFLTTLTLTLTSQSKSIANQQGTLYQVQKKLLELGYEVGTPDGIWGKQTETAIKNFQKDYKLPLTGKLDEETKKKIESLKIKEINGIIKSVSADGNTFKVSDDIGNEKTLIFDNNTQFFVKGKKVTSTELEKDTKVQITYEEGYWISTGGGFNITVNRSIKIKLFPLATNPVGQKVRFIDNGDGTITDTDNNQIWQKERCENSLTFQEAELYAKNLTLGNYSGWRLPEFDDFNNAIIAKFVSFNDEKISSEDNIFWTRDGSGKFLQFTPGVITSRFVTSKNSRLYVICVRDIPKEK
jgi:hypothetical protein